MALPAVPMALGVGLAVASFRQILKAEEDADRFAAMSWYDASDGDGDGCVLLGEEAAEDGCANRAKTTAAWTFFCAASPSDLFAPALDLPAGSSGLCALSRRRTRAWSARRGRWVSTPWLGMKRARTCARRRRYGARRAAVPLSRS
eukprot:4472295-Prymnesium_polylepis.1